MDNSPLPKQLAGRLCQKGSGRFRKGEPQPQNSTVKASPRAKKHKLERPKTAIFLDMRFHFAPASVPVITGSGDKATTQHLAIPNGNSICNMEILSLVFTQLNCVDRTCYGRLKLYKQHIQDGLQRFLLLKCTHCHNVVAEFPTTLPKGCSALDSVNNKSIRVKVKREINQ